MPNAYAPPKADVELAGQVAPPRPISITLLQVAGYAALSMASIGLVVNILQLFDSLRPSVSFNAAVLFLIVRAALVAAIAAMLVLVRKRHSAGKVLGLVFIAIVSVPFALILFKMKTDATIVHSVVWYGSSLVLLALSSLWAYKFAFAKGAKRYFSSRPS